MLLLRSVTLMAVLFQLTACFQVELTGPVSGASVSIEPLRGGAPIYEGLVTTNALYHQTELGAVVWAGFSPFVQLLHLGAAYFDKTAFNPDELYLVTARGGLDMDANSNRVIDSVGTLIGGEWHAVMTGAQLKKNNSRVSVLTEALYRSVQLELDEMSDEQILQTLGDMATFTVPDLNKDGLVNYSDALVWSNITRPETYTGPEFFLERLAFAVLVDLDDDILRAASSNVVQRASWQPANAGAEYADALIACATPVLVLDLCTLGQLPIIGMDNSAPVVADIMDRVVVSHPWLATRFEQILNLMPEDILLLLRSVTTIVLDAQTRPSYYSSASATIYLDAGSFWLTEEERQVITIEPDYRTDFGDSLGFWEYWRYIKDNDWAYKGYSEVDASGNRDLDDVVLWSAALLFHELAHANDFFPYTSLAELSLNATPYDTLWEIPSDQLASSYPLQSSELVGIANVLYFGASPTASQAQYSGADIGSFFAPDLATDLYAYSNQFEDLAMLFEEAMLAIHYGIERDVGFGDVPDGGVANSCADNKIAWGVRGRIGAPQIKDRVKQVILALLPERLYGAQIDALAAPKIMDSNRDWCENLVLGDGVTSQLKPLSVTAKPTDSVLPTTESEKPILRRVRPYL